MLLSWWSILSPSSDFVDERQLDRRPSGDKDYDDDDDDDGLWSRSRHDYNQTIITSTVTIRVTPREDFLVSWGCLSALLLCAIVWAAWQVYRERKIDVAPTRPTPNDRLPIIESASSAEVTRCVFRRLLLFAMLSRFICIPIMIWSDPVWCQFVGDTLPEMIFATAWTLLVTFFVQVVGIATGTGTNTTPSIVIQLTAYVVYLGLILLELVNSVASVLLYALLCCIYAALLGTIAYFLPRLLSVLKFSTLHDHLAWRLSVCTVVCLVLFAAHMIGFARIVVDPPQAVYWWWKYGCLEVLPSICFLVLLQPSAHHKDRASATEPWKRGAPASLVRVDSVGSSHSNSPHIIPKNSHKSSTSPVETTALSKSPPTGTNAYGATNV